MFEPTLAMITTNFEDYPDHRLRFFSLLHAITNHCFKCLFAMNPAQVKLLIDSIVWAFRHTERNVAETGLLLLEVCATSVRLCWLTAAAIASADGTVRFHSFPAMHLKVSSLLVQDWYFSRIALCLSALWCGY